MFHVFALTYYILLRCVTREYSMTSVTMKNYSIYATREYTTTNDEKYSIYATREYATIFDLHDPYYSLLEQYMKHVFVAGLVTGDFFFNNCGFSRNVDSLMHWPKQGSLQNLKPLKFVIILFLCTPTSQL